MISDDSREKNGLKTEATSAWKNNLEENKIKNEPIQMLLYRHKLEHHKTRFKLLQVIKQEDPTQLTFSGTKKSRLF